MTYGTIRSRRPGAMVRLGAVVTALALATTACGGGDSDDEGDIAAVDPGDNPEPQGEPRQGGSITVAIEGESNGWQPGLSTAAAPGYNVLYAIYDPLVMGTSEGTFEPYLAESFEPNEDFTSWTFTLRDGVTFHDGSELTADVVVQNIEFLKSPTSTLSGSLAEVAGVEAIDPLTVRYDLTGPNAGFPAVLTSIAGMPFSMENLDALGPDEANASPVGTGPYTFEEWQRDSSLTLAANQDYWGTELDLGPYLDEIVFRPIPDEDTRLQSMRSGDVDAFQTLRESIIGQAQDDVADGELALHTFLGNNSGVSILNTLVAPLDDVRVRQALAHGADPEQLIDVLGGTGIVEPRTQFFSEDSPFYSEAVAEAYPDFDPERATELLQEYIDDPQRSDGKSPGEPVTLEYNCQPDPSLTELSQLYQAFWGEIGVDVSLNTVEQAAHISNAVGTPASDPPFVGDFQANCWRSGDQGDPYNILRDEFGPVEQQPLNFTNYTSASIDEQLAVLASTTDVEEQRAAVEAIGLELAEEVPFLWVSSTVAAFGVDPALQNLSSWQLPGGSEGVGLGLFQGGTTMWGQVWLAE